MASHEIKASVTGTVFKIEVAVGASVDIGAQIVVLESMKMEIPVEAPATGKVQTILVNEGEAVSEGQTLAILVVA